MSSPNDTGCYCHEVKEQVAAAIQGIDLHPEAQTPGAPAPVALNDGPALARLAGAEPIGGQLPAWAGNFETTLNNQES